MVKEHTLFFGKGNGSRFQGHLSDRSLPRHLPAASCSGLHEPACDMYVLLPVFDVGHCGNSGWTSGLCNLKTILRRIEKYGYKGYFSIEMFDEELWKMPPKRAAKLMYKSMQNLRRSL